ncbi:MAG: hypothetical protein NZ850_09260 [Caldimicrobium sp.]|nr:hypothetical protein [Caldimicrobium sp.]
MIEEGAVLKTSEPVGPFIGRGLTKVSKVCPSAIHQGYSIVIPVEGFRG